MNGTWSPEKSDKLSYNNWLRETAEESQTILSQSTANILVELQGLQSALEQGITMEPSRVSRVIFAISHLTSEIRLLAILKGMR